MCLELLEPRGGFIAEASEDAIGALLVAIELGGAVVDVVVEGGESGEDGGVFELGDEVEERIGRLSHPRGAHLHHEGLLRVPHGRLVNPRRAHQVAEVVHDVSDVRFDSLHQNLLLLRRRCRRRRRRTSAADPAFVHRFSVCLLVE